MRYSLKIRQIFCQNIFSDTFVLNFDVSTCMYAFFSRCNDDNHIIDVQSSELLENDWKHKNKMQKADKAFLQCSN